MFLSIITPTFNRAYILPKCYESLTRQTLKDFEWIVVDDGSTDDTEELVKSFILEKKLDIKYVKQENGGKHVAHNRGAELANGEMFLCLDSDDMLTEDAVEIVKEYWFKNKTDNSTGVIAKRGSISKKQPICDSLDLSIKSSTMHFLFNEMQFKGDTALFFRTDIMKVEKFTSFVGEKFVPEIALYCDIDAHGEMLLLDKVLYLTEYLPDGLSSKFHLLLRKNPYGTAYSYYKQLCLAKSIKQKVKYAMLYNMFRTMFNGKNKIILKKRKLWILITFLPAVLYKKKFFKKFERKK